MRTLKKALSLVLVLAMVFALAVPGFAVDKSSEYTDYADVKNTEAVDVLTAIDVLNGNDDGSFGPEGSFTRAQAATIIAKMLMGSDAKALTNTATQFNDVPATHWASGYIQYCASKGIIKGDGVNFMPDQTLTAAQWALMLLGALGYDAAKEGIGGTGFEIPTTALAIQAGVASADEMAGTFNRDVAAKMAMNTMTASLVTYSRGISITTGDTSISVDSNRSYVDDIGDTAARHYNNVDDNKTQFCERYFPTLKLVNTTDSFGVKSNFWFKGNSSTDVARTPAKTITSAATATVLATYTDTVGTITQADLYSLTGVAGSIDVYENGTANGTVTSAKGNTTKVFTAYVGATVKVVDNDANGVADAVIVEYPYLAKVTKVTAATASVDRYVTMTVYNDDGMTATTGVTYTTEDFAKDDYVLVYAGDKMSVTETWNNTQISADILKVTAAEKVTGKVTKVTGTNGTAVTALTVDGTSYGVAADKYATQGLTAGSKLVKATAYDFTQEYTFLMNNGKILGVLGQANAAASSANYVYVVGATYTTKDAYGTDVYNVEVVNLDGTVETLPNKNTTNDVGGTALAAGFYVKGYDSTAKQYTFTKATVSTTTPINNTSVIFATNEVNGATAMTTTTKALPIDAVNTDGNTKAYVTEGTKILFVSGAKATLKVTTATGAIAQNIPDNSKVLLSKDAQGNYIVDTLVITTAQVDVSGTVVYATSTATGVNANGSEYAIYSTTTGEKETVTASAAGGDTFATYTVNDKGVYTFANVSAAAAKNGNGVFTVNAQKLGAYGTAISAECGTHDIEDLDASNAVIVNLITDSTQSLTLADLHAATNVTAKILVKDNAVVAIVVTAWTPAS